MGKKHILTVDDDRHFSELVQFNLEKAGYKITTAYNGKDAVEKAAKKKFDLIVLDVMMPEMDGFETCRRLMHEEKTLNTPIVFLTAKTGQEDRFKGMVGGAAYYISKPFDMQDLLKKIQKIFMKKQK